MAANNTHQDDRLDSFLTTIESKLRGPFSSLDLAKAVTTTALRTTALRRSSQLGNESSLSSKGDDDDDDPAREYLQNLSSVFSRTNKVIQCRMLIGLLGLNDIKNVKDTNDDNENNSNTSTSSDDGAKYLTPEILNILHQTQEGPLHEEWVRTTSGLIEGVMFRTKNKNTRESCRSKEATKIIVTTGTGICKKVESQIQNCCQPYYTKDVKKRKKKLSGIVDNDNDNDSNKQSTKNTSSTRTVNKRTRGFKIGKTIPSSSKSSSDKKSMKQASILNGIKNEQQEVPRSDLLPPTPDLNAAFAPYRYRLISTAVLNTIVPEFDIHKNNKNSNCHFQVNSDADILKVDLQLEAQRAKDHGAGVGGSAKASSTMVKNDNNNNNNGAKNNTNSLKSSKRTFPPGFRPVKLVPTSTSGTMNGRKRKADTSASSSSSSNNNLSMPKRKKSSNLFNTTTKFRPQAAKTILRRKGGGAQGLLKTGNASGGGAILSKLGNGSSGGSGGVGGGGSGNSTTIARGSGRFSGKKRDTGRGIKSKMKMIDVDDVDILSKQRSAAGANNTKMSTGKLEKLRASKREQILKKGRTSAPPPPVATATKNQISSSSPPRPVVKQRFESATTVVAAAAAAAPQQQKQQEDIESWNSLLRDRSNKMSVDDKARGERFFTTNQTERSQLEEGGPVYKIKIHEQRGKDPSTQQEIKETFYLELDYNTGEQKQSRKVKRY